MSGSPDPQQITPKQKEGFYAVLCNRLVWLMKQGEIYLQHAPAFEKYGLCLEIRKKQYEAYNYVTECRKRYWNKTTLTKLDVVHEQIRCLWKLFHELGYFDYHKEAQLYDEAKALKRFRAMNERIDEVGKMIGGLLATAKKLGYMQ